MTKYYGSGFGLGLDGIYYPERSRYKNAYLPERKSVVEGTSVRGGVVNGQQRRQTTITKTK